jgi:hypothetical protein
MLHLGSVARQAPRVKLRDFVGPIAIGVGVRCTLGRWPARVLLVRQHERFHECDILVLVVRVVVWLRDASTEPSVNDNHIFSGFGQTYGSMVCQGILSEADAAKVVGSAVGHITTKSEGPDGRRHR